MMDSVGIRDRDTRKGAVSSVQNKTICGQPHPTVPSTPPPGPLKLPAGPKMRTAASWLFAVFEVMGGIVSPTARSNAIAPQDPRRSLPVVPLIPDKRYYGV